MKYTVVMYNQINPNLFRLDAEHHVGIAKLNMSRLQGYKLADICSKIVQGPNPTFVDSGITSFNGKNIYFGTVDAGEFNYISEAEYDSFKPYHLKKNDILIILKHASRVGRLWIYRKDEKRLFSRNIGVIRLKKDAPIYHEIMVSYLWGDHLQELLNLIATGGTNGQITLSMAELRDIPVPKFSEAIQQYVANIFKQGEELINDSEKAYQQAHTILLSELGLLNWQSKHRLSFVKNYSDAQYAERLDADYFQPKYDDIVAAIKRYAGGCDTLGNIASTKRGSLISDSFYDENEGRAYIRGADFSGGLLSKEKMVYINSKFLQTNETVVNRNDIVFSLIGSVGETALVTEEFQGSYISNNTGKVTVKKQLLPEVLQIFLYSIIGKMYFEKYKTQTAQPKISDKDIHNFVIPILKNEIQAEIRQKMIESFTLRKQSKHLLECAKRAVEIAIEQDEQAALALLERSAALPR